MSWLAVVSRSPSSSSIAIVWLFRPGLGNQLRVNSGLESEAEGQYGEDRLSRLEDRTVADRQPPVRCRRPAFDSVSLVFAPYPQWRRRLFLCSWRPPFVAGNPSLAGLQASTQPAP